MFKYNKSGIVKAIIISMIINTFIITLYITFVFGMKKDIFVINEDVLDKQMVAYLETLSSRLDYYDNKINKIINSYPFVDFIDISMTNDINDDEVSKIVELFVGIEKPFASVSLSGKDGRVIFSRPIRINSNDIANNIKVKDSSIVFTSYEDFYDGIEFTAVLKDIENDVLGYVSASVDKSIFSDIVENSDILLLPNGVIYYGNNTDISKTSKEKLVSLLNNTSEEGSYFAKIDGTGLLFYASLLNRILGFNIGFIVEDIVPLQKYFKYIILIVLILSLIFLTSILVFELIKKRNEFLDDHSDTDLGQINALPIINNSYKKEVDDELEIEDDLKNILDETDYFDSVDLSNNIDDFLLEDKVVDEDGVIEEDDYFASKEAFNVSLDENFLFEKSDDEKNNESYVDELLDKNDRLESDYLTGDELENIDDVLEAEEVPKIPDDYYNNIENEDSNTKSKDEEYEILLKSIKNKNFVEKDINYMLDWVRNYFHFNIDIIVMLGYNAVSREYVVVDSDNISPATRELLKIGERENIFSKLLGTGKPVDIQNPYSSKSLSVKFDSDDIEGISRMLFIPIESVEGGIKSFFILGFKGL